MKRLTVLRAVAVLPMLGVGMAVVLAARKPQPARVPVKAAKTERNMPLVLSKHMEKLQQGDPRKRR